MKRIINIIIVPMLLLLSMMSNLAAQDKNGAVVTGTVTDKVHGGPLPGVLIMFESHTWGVMTDAEGHYSIRRPEEGGEMLFSLIGYETKRVKITNQTTLNVALVEAQETLDEVVVTGYSPIRKEGFSGNATRVTKTELVAVNPNNLISALQTFDPSFRIAENLVNGSNPNSLPEFALRGQTSSVLDVTDVSRQSLVGTSNMPIFILDGFEVDIEKIYDLDPSRIHSISILKDAAATAFYGSRAANGVIVIELRAPEAGRLRTTYNGTLQLEVPDLSSYNLMNAAEKLEAERLSGAFDYPNPSISPYSNGYYARKNNIIRGIDTYWLSMGLRTGINQRHSVYVDGGEQDVRWGVSLDGNLHDGVMQLSSRKVLGAGFYVDYRLGKVQIKNKANFTYRKSNDVPFNNFGDYSHLQPYLSPYNEDGSYARSLEALPGYAWSLVNPLYEIHNYKSFNTSYNQEIVDNLLVNWNITKGLKLRLQSSATITESGSDTFKDPASASFGNSALSLSGTKNTGSGRSLLIDGTLQLMYNRTIEKHHINTNLSANLRSSDSSNETASYRGFPGGDLTGVNHASEIIGKPVRSDDKSRLLGFLLTGNYTWGDIYFGDLTGRIDGASAFGSKNRWSLFWSAGAGINIHNYSFLKNNKTLSTLKFRGSYGLTGKTNISQYSALNLYDLQPEWFPTGYGVFLSQMGNPDLRWERTYQLDFGTEIGLWRDRVYLKASRYHERTVDLITDFALPSSTGFSSRKQNMGVVRNVGTELDLRVRAYQDRDFLVTVFGSFARNKNTVVEISEAMEAYNKKVEELFKDFNPSSSASAEYARPYLKYYEGASMTAIAGMRSLGISPSNGKEIYLRPNGEPTDKWSASDWVVIGDTAPKGQGSFGASFSWKRFTMYSSFLYHFGGDAYNSTLVNYVENVNMARDNVDRRVLLDRWQKPGDVTTLKDIRDRNVTTGSTSRFVQKDNTLQMSSLTLSYDFEEQLLKKVHISMCRLSLTANDVFYTSTIRRERGLAYPFARSFSFSLNLSF